MSIDLAKEPVSEPALKKYIYSYFILIVVPRAFYNCAFASHKLSSAKNIKTESCLQQCAGKPGRLKFPYSHVKFLLFSALNIAIHKLWHSNRGHICGSFLVLSLNDHGQLS